MGDHGDYFAPPVIVRSPPADQPVPLPQPLAQPPADQPVPLPQPLAPVSGPSRTASARGALTVAVLLAMVASLVVKPWQGDAGSVIS